MGRAGGHGRCHRPRRVNVRVASGRGFVSHRHPGPFDTLRTDLIRDPLRRSNHGPRIKLVSNVSKRPG